MQPHKIVSRGEWVDARKAHLANEKRFTRVTRCHGRWRGCATMTGRKLSIGRSVLPFRRKAGVV